MGLRRSNLKEGLLIKKRGKYKQLWLVDLIHGQDVSIFPGNGSAFAHLGKKIKIGTLLRQYELAPAFARTLYE